MTVPASEPTAFDTTGCGGIATDVQYWVDNPTLNYGWLLVSPNAEASGASTANRIYTREGGNAPALTFNYSCKAPYEVDVGNAAYCTTCTTAARNACHVGNGNTCSDPGTPSTAYSCSCNGTSYEANGTTACKDIDGCSGSDAACTAGGYATGKCVDVPAPGTGYTCTCTPSSGPASGFYFNGVTCVSACNPPSSNPCGNGGTCANGAGGTWTCSGCAPGYTSNNLPQAACVEIKACDTAAIAACVASPTDPPGTGNVCVDDPPPSPTYTCTCGGAYFETKVAGKSTCGDKNECTGNTHCSSNGDVGATCNDNIAPATGYSCACTSARWKEQIVGGFNTCVDVDECAGSTNPCVHGTCTNIPAGGGYSCACDAPYVLRDPGQTPRCGFPDPCVGDAVIACASNQPGNQCIEDMEPQQGYTCACANPAYVINTDKSRCLNVNGCAMDPCSTGGDTKSECIDNAAPLVGYQCNCGPGFTYDGTTCVDINECASANPCAPGACANTIGSYQCACTGGATASVDSTGHAICAAGHARHAVVTETKGSLCNYPGDAERNPLHSLFWLMAMIGAARLAGVRRRTL